MLLTLQRRPDRVYLAVLIALVALLVAGCAEDAPALTAATCVAGEGRDNGNRAPDVSTIVPCTTAHRFEVYATADLPKSALSGPGSQAERRQELAVPAAVADSSPQRKAFEAFAERRCTNELLKVTGYDTVTISKKTAAAVRLVPAMRDVYAPWYTVAPEKQWLAGQHQVLCNARYARPVAGAGPSGDRQAARQLLLALARTTDFPAALRPCRAYDAARSTVDDVPCSEPHVSETLFYFEARQALGTKYVNNVLADPSPEAFDRLDQVCTAALPQLLGKNYDRRLRGFGSAAREWTDKNTTARCDVGPKDFRTTDLPAGSLVGAGTAKLQLIPVP